MFWTVILWGGWLVSVLGALGLAASAVAALLVRNRSPSLIDLPYAPLDVWPHLSVIVPACNEAETIEAALSSLLREDYPELEIVVVNDRSTDGTGGILERMAQAEPRIVVVHVNTLPDGWLGKVHALARGLEKSSGEWVLFTDADVHFEVGALRRAVAWSVREGQDHLSLLPRVPLSNFLLGISIAATLRSLMLMARMWEANDPKSMRGMGVGAFNLVRREALDASPGLEWLKLEVADDVGMGIMMKRLAGRSRLLVGGGLIHVEWYLDLRSAIRGLEKNAFAQAARFSAIRGCALGLAGLSLAFAPFLGLLPGSPSIVRLLCLGCILIHVLVSMNVASDFMVKKRYLVFSTPFGDLMMAIVVLWGTWRGIRRGGVVWRGTHYPSAVLAAGRRVDL